MAKINDVSMSLFRHVPNKPFSEGEEELLQLESKLKNKEFSLNLCRQQVDIFSDEAAMSDYIVVVKLEDEIVGLALGILNSWRETKDLEVTILCTAKKSPMKIGSFLMSFIKYNCEHNKIVVSSEPLVPVENIVLNAVDNAVGFYEKQGFKIKTQDNYSIWMEYQVGTHESTTKQKKKNEGQVVEQNTTSVYVDRGMIGTSALIG